MHVVIELEGESNLNQPQCRLLAECFDHMLYYDLAEKYWLKVFEYPFLIPELEAEYYRSYAMFLYKIQKKDVGEDVFKKSLSCLMNTTDAHRYINIFTLSIWIKEESIFFDENVLKDNGKQNIVYCYRNACSIFKEIKNPMLQKNAFKLIKEMQAIYEKFNLNKPI